MTTFTKAELAKMSDEVLSETLAAYRQGGFDGEALRVLNKEKIRRFKNRGDAEKPTHVFRLWWLSGYSSSNISLHRSRKGAMKAAEKYRWDHYGNSEPLVWRDTVKGEIAAGLDGWSEDLLITKVRVKK